MSLAALTPLSLVILSLPAAQVPGGSGGPPPQAPVQEESTIDIIPLRYADAGSVLTILRHLNQPEPISCDQRMNALVLQATKSRLAELRALIAKLDRPAEEAAFATPPAPALPELFAPVTADLEIAAAEGESLPNLMSVARRYEELTGQLFRMSEETRQLLENCSLGLHVPISVKAQDVQTFVEHLFAANSFYIMPLKGCTPPLIEIASSRTQEGRRIASLTQYIAPEQVESYSRMHPAVPACTVIEMKVDVRHLSNTLRTIFVDSLTLFVIPAGSSNSMIVGGDPSAVNQVLRMLREIDGHAEAIPAPAPSAETKQTEEK